MNKKNAKLGGCLLCLSVLTAWIFSGGFALATDGTMGNDSTGDLSMNLTIPELVKVSGISNYDFGTYSGSGNAVISHTVCVYANYTSGHYKLTLRGSGIGHAYNVIDAGAHTIAYTARWDTDTTVGGEFNVDADSQTAQLSGANTSSQNCGGGGSARLEITMTRDHILSKPAGTYAGTLTIIIDQDGP